ncbi:hypothetical protein LTR51_004490 [Lithohypha guttulata]|uniref:Cytochrome b5 heme-binding domain-containing protein n=2 Tax=Lithohypha guttulata TaxID=1690604 RepID=A0AAN7YK33_9EURO|nr:hypothetical protein LTR51_004490 [Lithohypha guttulata]KAK5091098.1 hypothetical protein LTR05_001278 [Lithohypha guttulata]
MEKQFAPKVPVELNEPKQDLISKEELAKANGTDHPEGKIYVAIKGVVFDVTRNKAYQPGGSYHVFAGKDPSRALASSSLKADECVPDWYDLEEEKKTVLNDWFKFFSKRYDIVGKVDGADNFDPST